MARTDDEAPAEEAESSGLLDWIERVGNKVPNPTIMFVYLIAFIAVLSAALSALGVEVTDDVVVPVPREEFNQINEHLGGTWSIYDSTTGEPAVVPDSIVSEGTFPVRNLLSVEGLRHFFSSFVDNFAGFGVISSVATDAGYLILVPLAAAAFLSIGRHPLAGLAAAFAGVRAVFGANVLITPSDSMLTEITNEVLSTAGMPTIEVTQNFYFGVVSSIVLAAVALLVTVFVTEKRLGLRPVVGDLRRRRRRGRLRGSRRLGGGRAQPLVRGRGRGGLVPIVRTVPSG